MKLSFGKTHRVGTTAPVAIISLQLERAAYLREKRGSAGKTRSPLNEMSLSVLQECSTSILLLMVELAEYRKCSSLPSPALMAASKKCRRVCQLRSTIRGVRSLVVDPAVEMWYIDSTLNAIFSY